MARIVFIRLAIFIVPIAFFTAQSNPVLAQGAHSASSYVPPSPDAILPDVVALPHYFLPIGPPPPQGLIIEMSLAPPVDIPTDPYELGKYGRIAVDYTRMTTFDGSDVGIAAQALHVAHHLLFYSMGLSSDINNDGMFLLTLGLAHYQTGNNRAEPFVDAPFIRLRFQSSPKDIFAYSEIETTMHFRQYLSVMTGLGLRVSPVLRLMGGIAH